MLPKVNRASRKTLDVFFSSDPTRKKVFVTAHSPLFLVKCAKADKNEKSEINDDKFTFVVSSSVEKSAVGRNLLKRRARAIVQSLLKNLVTRSLGKPKGGHIVMFIFKKPAVSSSFKDLEKEINSVLEKLGLF